MSTATSGASSDQPATASENPASMLREALDRDPRDVHRDARYGLAAATRSVIRELVSSTADSMLYEEAASLVGRAARLLETANHGRTYDDPAEASLVGSRPPFVDFSPLFGPLNPLSPPMTMSFIDGSVVGTVEFGPAYEGPPGHVHGGFIAAAFDEVLGLAQSLSGNPGMTATLDVAYRAPTPLFSEVRFVGWIDHVEGRKITTSATLHAGETLCAEATGLFISMRPGFFERLMNRRAGATPASSPGSGVDGATIDER